MNAKDYVWLTALGCVLVFAGYQLADRRPGADEFRRVESDLQMYKLRTEALDVVVQEYGKSQLATALAMKELLAYTLNRKPIPRVLTQTNHSIEQDAARRAEVKGQP